MEECPIEQGTRVERCGAPPRAASQGVDMSVGDVSINNGLRNWTVELGIPSTEQTGGSPDRIASAVWFRFAQGHSADESYLLGSNLIYEYSLCRYRDPHRCSGNITTQGQRRKILLHFSQAG